ncbi:MAG: hypothetical protein HKN47_21185 [Pirellulaceae bacterium]|nr:hypothetical protein [Pirellulaceae bacterium]
MSKLTTLLFALLLCSLGIVVLNVSRSSIAQRDSGPFVPPDARARKAAIGSTDRLDRSLSRALEPTDQFAAIPTPGPSDWLAQHHEPGQTYAQFVQRRPNRPDQKRNKLYFQPLGDFDPANSPDLELLADFARAFFTLDVQILPLIELDSLPIKVRPRQNQPRQLLSTDVLTWLESRVAEDAYALLAITMDDLYPEESWNFVFGQASLRNRVGVYSFVRYTPEFYGQQSDSNTSSLILERSCKVLSHETGHMFGIRHCVHFHCLMNGSNHLGESDAQPIHLCPVCLRKLQSSVNFDVQQRYQSLQEFSERARWQGESAWLSGRLKHLSDR